MAKYVGVSDAEGAKIESQIKGAVVPASPATQPILSPYTPQATNTPTVTPATPVNTITSTQLTTPVTPLKTKNVATPTISSGILASVDGINQQAQANTAGLVDTSNLGTLQANNIALQTRITDLLNTQQGTAQLTADEYANQGVNKAQTELNDINAQINSKTLAYRRQIEKRQKNLEGSFGGAVEADVANIERVAASELADLSVIQLAKQNNYSAAKEIADRSVQAKLEQQKNELDALQFFYTENKEELNKKDDRQFQTLIAERTRLLEEQENSLNRKNEYVLESLKNGAPANIVQAMQSAATPEQALEIGGSYIGKIEREQARASIANIYSQINDRNQDTVIPDADAPLYAGLNSSTATAVRGQVGAFKSEPVVTNFSTIQEGFNTVKGLSDSTRNPSDDQALIYAFAKVLDPSSVVRETEYATAQKYAQSWAQAYGKSVTQALNGTGFLSEDARKNIKQTIKNRYESSKKSYDSLRNNYADGINKLTGRDNGNDFIRDYITQENPEETALLKEENIFDEVADEQTGYFNNIWKSILGK
jgi:hypothetical protein